MNSVNGKDAGVLRNGVTHINCIPKYTYGYLRNQFSRFGMSPKCYAVQCIVNGEGNPLPFWDFVTLPEEDWATTIGNMHKKTEKR